MIQCQNFLFMFCKKKQQKNNNFSCFLRFSPRKFWFWDFIRHLYIVNNKKLHIKAMSRLFFFCFFVFFFCYTLFDHLNSGVFVRKIKSDRRVICSRFFFKNKQWKKWGEVELALLEIIPRDADCVMKTSTYLVTKKQHINSKKKNLLHRKRNSNCKPATSKQ